MDLAEEIVAARDREGGEGTRERRLRRALVFRSGGRLPQGLGFRLGSGVYTGKNGPASLRTKIPNAYGPEFQIFIEARLYVKFPKVAHFQKVLEFWVHLNKG